MISYRKPTFFFFFFLFLIEGLAPRIGLAQVHEVKEQGQCGCQKPNRNLENLIVVSQKGRVQDFTMRCLGNT